MPKRKNNATGDGGGKGKKHKSSTSTTTTTTTTTTRKSSRLNNDSVNGGSSSSSSSSSSTSNIVVNDGGDGDGGGDGAFDISNKDGNWLRNGGKTIDWSRFYEYVDKVKNEHITIELNNGSVSMDTKWIKAVYNLGLASLGNCPGNGLLFTKSSLNMDRRISCRCVDSKHCSKICGLCGPVCGECECIKSGRRKVLQQQGEGSKVSFMSDEAKRKYLANIHKL